MAEFGLLLTEFPILVFCSGLKGYDVQSAEFYFKLNFLNLINSNFIHNIQIFYTCIMSKIHSEFKIRQNNPQQNQN